MALAFTQQAMAMSSLGGQTPKMWCCASPRFCPAILFEMDCIAIDDDTPRGLADPMSAI